MLLKGNVWHFSKFGVVFLTVMFWGVAIIFPGLQIYFFSSLFKFSEMLFKISNQDTRKIQTSLFSYIY